MSACCWRPTSAEPRRCSDSSREAPERPTRIEVGEFITLDYDSLVPMIREFLKANGVEARAIDGGDVRRRRARSPTRSRG